MGNGSESLVWDKVVKGLVSQVEELLTPLSLMQIYIGSNFQEGLCLMEIRKKNNSYSTVCYVQRQHPQAHFRNAKVSGSTTHLLNQTLHF